jgi:drug/metabolite transporter (DMT)-like permease
MHWLSILLILLGVLSLSFNLRDWRSASGPALIAEAPLALLAGTLWGLVYFLSKYMVLWFGALPAAFMLELGVLAGAGIHLLHSKGRLSLPPHPLLPTLALLALCGVAGTLFYNLGLESANVSIVAALCFSSPLVAALYGLVVYKEKLGIWQWGAMGLILAGIVMLQFSA